MSGPAGHGQAPRSGGQGEAPRLSRTLTRLERILVMVPWLLDHPGADLEEVADRFGTTKAQLADDLDVLGYCGVPGYGGGDLIEVSIFGGCVTVRMADFFRRPLRLSLREALTLLLAGRAVENVQGIGKSVELQRALAKVERVLGDYQGSPQDPLCDTGSFHRHRGRCIEPPHAAAPSFAIDLSSPGEEHLPILRIAAAAGQVVHLVYWSGSKAETTERDVEPWALTGFRGAWYLQGWCRLAGAPRDFRLDRIRAVTVTGEPVPVDRPRQQTSPAYEPSTEDQTIVLDLHRPAWWLAEWVVYERVEETERHEIRRITMQTSQLEWVARLLLRLGEHVEVVAPAELTERVARLARETLNHYQTH
jgi:predicted DNA-binding transcriptional regulator YafY